MKEFFIALIYIAFCALIGFCVYILKSGYVLLALLFWPDITVSSDSSGSNNALKKLINEIKKNKPEQP